MSLKLPPMAKIILALPIWIYPLELPLGPIVFIRKWFCDGFMDD